MLGNISPILQQIAISDHHGHDADRSRHHGRRRGRHPVHTRPDLHAADGWCDPGNHRLDSVDRLVAGAELIAMEGKPCPADTVPPDRTGPHDLGPELGGQIA